MQINYLSKYQSFHYSYVQHLNKNNFHEINNEPYIKTNTRGERGGGNKAVFEII